MKKNKIQKDNLVTCLIPFYNENKRILKTLSVISKIKEIDKIICIDDGSTDNTYKKIKSEFPRIKLIILKTNQGKSAAVFHGLKQVNTEWVFLLDADLVKLQTNEIKKAIQTIKNLKNIDMLILRRANYSKFVTLIRHDILMSGERILRTKDAIQTFQKPPNGYQLEVAINHYLLNENKKCYWQQTSLTNSYKLTKWKPKQAAKKYYEEISGYTSYAGTINYLKQLKQFCKNPINYYRL